MKLKEITLVNLKCDYWFLRDNHVHSKTALRMVGLAYKEYENENNKNTS